MVTLSKSIRRVGCGALLVVWFGLLVIVPCGAVTLISGGEIRLAHSDIPDDNTLRIWLIDQPSERGLGISTGYTIQRSDGTLCVITTTRFILWKGSGATSRSCACYAGQSGNYNLSSEGADACQAAGLT